jgi:filamentous hemagglutinin family protein
MKLFLFPLGLGLVCAWSCGAAQAQVTSDGSLSTRVNSADGRNFVIEEGDRRGNNLFHSFSDFSVPTGGSASFNNAIDIQNIFTRVTGNNVSNIDGLLRANGRANLFLLNPNGILFGRNAQLFLGGSFIGSTAQRLRFADGTLFDATLSTAPLLTVSVPTGLQFTANAPGQIKVQGNGNSEIVPTTNFGLAVAPGQTFALVGGDVVFDGGIVTTAAGRLEIGAVGRGEVSLTPSLLGWELGYGRVEQFRDAQFLNRSSLWQPLSSSLGGIQVQGQRIVVNNSQIAAVAGGNPLAGDLPGGDIRIGAAGSLTVGGTGAIYPFSSWIVNQVAPTASNAGGAIQINTPLLNITEGSRIQTLSQGGGSAGNIQVNADVIGIRGSSAAAADPLAQDLFNSRITSDAIANGNGGDIQISARRINLSQGGQIATLVAPQATGNGGTLRVNATERIRAIGVNPFSATQSSGLSSLTVGAGNGGNLNIRGDRFMILDGGSIQSQVLGAGRGGDISVRATDTITGRGNTLTLQGGVSSFTLGSGDSGNINLTTNHLSLFEGSSISVGNLSQTAAQTSAGSGGNITVKARQSIELVGVSPLTLTPSGISTATNTPGSAGNINISTRQLEARQGGSIASGTLFSVARGQFTGTGTGRGGNVRVNASEAIALQGVDNETALAAVIDTYTTSRGNAGQLIVQTPELVVESGAALGSLNSAAGQAGRVMINANHILVSGVSANQTPAEIFSTARIPEASIRQAFNLPDVPTGATGTLTVNADRITIADGGRINVQHQGIGNAGQLRLNTNQLILQNQGQISATTASGEGGDIRLNVTDQLLMRDRAQISTTARGRGGGGNIQLNSPVLIGVDNSDILAQAQAGQGGNIDINSESILGIASRPSLTSESDINASSQLGVNGSVAISTPSIEANSGLIVLPSEVVDGSQQIANRCASAADNRFVVTGRGGVPASPEILRGDRPWADLRDLSAFDSSTAQAALPVEGHLVEASAFQQNAMTGKMELVLAEGRSDALGRGSEGMATCAGAN